MENTNWLRQAPDRPLFPDVLWSRPENKRQAGKLLIIGGNSHGFSAPITAYNAATASGVGSARVILPDALQKPLGTSFAEAKFAPSTPSGSLARRALDLLLESANWADGVLLGGDFGRNSETAVLLSSFLEKFSGQVTVAQDGLDYFLASSSALLSRPDTLSVINMGKLQKLGKNNRPDPPIRHAMSLHDLVKVIGGWHANVITKHSDNFVSSSAEAVSTTPSIKEHGWEVELAAYTAVWWLQNREKPFEALTTAVFEYAK